MQRHTPHVDHHPRARAPGPPRPGARSLVTRPRVPSMGADATDAIGSTRRARAASAPLMEPLRSNNARINAPT